jgi:hypothetical protein
MIHLVHRFVEFIPVKIESGVIYIALEYGTVTHLCCCGCGKEVVTPLTPTDWKLTFDGESVSLHPSIGSWSLPCRSHYWIRNNRVSWAEDWTDDRVNQSIEDDLRLKTDHYGPAASSHPNSPERKLSIWERLKNRLFNGKSL